MTERMLIADGILKSQETYFIRIEALAMSQVLFVVMKL